MNLKRLKGFMMVIIGAGLWGLSGTVAQDLFQTKNISMGWLVTVRLLVSGVILLIIASLRNNGNSRIWSIWKDSKARIQLILFGIFGMLGVQYTYFASIETGNAAVATLLQYLAPMFITLYFIIRYKSLPSRIEFIAIVLALSGTFLLLTNGSMENLSVSIVSIVWGVLSGIALAFYTLYAGNLLKKWGSPIVVGWGMIVGGIGMSFVHSPWQVEIQNWSMETALFIAFVIFFGTLIAFYLFLESLRYISPKETSLLGCTEPFAAVLSSVIWLHVSFGLFQGVGTFFVIMMVILLSLKPDTSKKVDTANNGVTVDYQAN